ncbi:hypothetical protein PQO01_03540 [Lentisphaera marina]|uniref:hypothetical protein n=1 Tax=Lentisphaera marina TaxID=1111041 RepID=UPI0023665ED2|nr:hypothetical protein [Lentisphaera marina]MDD7984024.1 hypothetical protein [Lentisphaera marina]
MRLTLLLFTSLLFNTSAFANSVELDFDKAPLNSTEVPGVKGKFKIVADTKDNHILQVFSEGKNDSAKIRILLKTPKNKDSFKLTTDLRVNTSATPAGKLLTITDWDVNKELFRLETTSGKLKLRATNLESGKLKASEICAYQANTWMTLELVLNRSKGVCQISLVDKGSSKPIYQGTHTINKQFKHIYMASSVWPGQAKTGYSYQFDNIKVKHK